MTTKIKEAPANGKTIFEYAPDSNAAEDYAAVVDRIIHGVVGQVTGTTENQARGEDTFARTA